MRVPQAIVQDIQTSEISQYRHGPLDLKIGDDIRLGRPVMAMERQRAFMNKERPAGVSGNQLMEAAKQFHAEGLPPRGYIGSEFFPFEVSVGDDTSCCFSEMLCVIPQKDGLLIQASTAALSHYSTFGDGANSKEVQSDYRAKVDERLQGRQCLPGYQMRPPAIPEINKAMPSQLVRYQVRPSLDQKRMSSGHGHITKQTMAAMGIHSRHTDDQDSQWHVETDEDTEIFANHLSTIARTDCTVDLAPLAASLFLALPTGMMQLGPVVCRSVYIQLGGNPDDSSTDPKERFGQCSDEELVRRIVVLLGSRFTDDVSGYRDFLRKVDPVTGEDVETTARADLAFQDALKQATLHIAQMCRAEGDHQLPLYSISREGDPQLKEKIDSIQAQLTQNTQDLYDSNGREWEVDQLQMEKRNLTRELKSAQAAYAASQKTAAKRVKECKEYYDIKNTGSYLREVFQRQCEFPGELIGPGWVRWVRMWARRATQNWIRHHKEPATKILPGTAATIVCMR